MPTSPLCGATAGGEEILVEGPLVQTQTPPQSVPSHLVVLGGSETCLRIDSYEQTHYPPGFEPTRMGFHD